MRNIQPAVIRANPERVLEIPLTQRKLYIGIGVATLLAVLIILVAFFGSFPAPERIFILVSIFVALLALVTVRLILISRKAKQSIGVNGEILAFYPEGISLLGKTLVPWEEINFVYGLDLSPSLYAQSNKLYWKISGPLMIKAGVNKTRLLINVKNISKLKELTSESAVKAGKPDKNGISRGVIDLHFGIYLEPNVLYEVVNFINAQIGDKVPVKILESSWDYGVASSILSKEDEDTATKISGLKLD